MRLDDGRMIPNFFRQALRGHPLTVFGDGSQTRSIMYVDDLVEGVWRLLCSSYVGPVNIGSQDEVSVLELARTIVRVTGSKSEIAFGPLPPDDPKVRRPDNALAKRVLGWEPRVPVEQGLRRTQEWFAEALARDRGAAR
jgi:dTDP-glucose 4,6-dehydratase